MRARGRGGLRSSNRSCVLQDVVPVRCALSVCLHAHRTAQHTTKQAPLQRSTLYMLGCASSGRVPSSGVCAQIPSETTMQTHTTKPATNNDNANNIEFQNHRAKRQRKASKSGKKSRRQRLEHAHPKHALPYWYGRARVAETCPTVLVR